MSNKLYADWILDYNKLSSENLVKTNGFNSVTIKSPHYNSNMTIICDDDSYLKQISCEYGLAKSTNNNLNKFFFLNKKNFNFKKNAVEAIVNNNHNSILFNGVKA